MQTQTGTRSRQKRNHQAAQPFSATAARLIETLQAEARAATLVELSAKDGVVVLHGIDAITKQVEFLGDFMDIRDIAGNELHLYRNRYEPESWQGKSYMAGRWHPSYWRGEQTLIDTSGVEWTRKFDKLVCDDFGNLVQVAA